MNEDFILAQSRHFIKIQNSSKSYNEDQNFFFVVLGYYCV